MHDFLEIIRKYSRNYRGPHTLIVENLEPVYVLINRLVSRQRLPHAERVMALAAIGYFCVFDNVVSVYDFGAEGYLDDAYLACWVLRRCLDAVGAEELYEQWQGST